MKYICIKLVLILLFSSLTGCKDSNEPENTYQVNVTNSLGTDIDIFIRSSSQSENENYGTIATTTERTFSGFEISVTYILTATEVGGSPDNWFYQTEFSNTTTSALNIQISPQF